MKIKRFFAKDMRTVLKEVKALFKKEQYPDCLLRKNLST